jgi:hypothetical protein
MTGEHEMKLALRLFATMILVALILFCVFGFLATFEPLEPAVQMKWRFVYGIVATSAATVIVLVNRRRQPGPQAGRLS